MARRALRAQAVKRNRRRENMNWMRIAIIAVLVVAVVGTARVLFAADDASLPQAGQPAHDFTLPSQDGSGVHLADLRGKWVVLYFYPKDMTSGCTLEAHNFQRDLAKYDQANAVILGVSVDSVDSHKQFCTKDSLTFKLLADPDKKVVDEYGSAGNYGGMKIAKRNTFLIDPKGNIAKVWTGVNPSTHSEEVLATLKELQAQ
jgi:peroxiredoxin Q/BCP